MARFAASLAVAKSVTFIDTHVHLADVSAFDYGFVSMFPDLAQNWTMSEFAKETLSVRSSMKGVLLMELDMANASSDVDLREAAFYQSIADACDAEAAARSQCVPVLGIVAGAPVHEGGVAMSAYLDKLLEVAPLTKGVREAIWKKGSDFFLSEDFVAGLQEVAARNLTFDLLVKSWQLQDAAKLARRVPALRFNLNHIGYPSISNASAASDAQWYQDIASLADLPNVYCKLSGLPQTYNKDGWLEHWQVISSYVAHVLKVFGVKRVNFAGNWFVLNHDGWNNHTAHYKHDSWSYESMVTLVESILTSLDLSHDDLDAVYSGTARSLYRLEQDELSMKIV